jgi:TonB family protein
MGSASLSADIWSLGITLVEALTNRLPARDKDGNPKLPDLPPPFDTIAKGCLAPDRERRLSTTAICNLLDRPVIEVVAETKAAAKSEATLSSDVRPSPAYGSAAAATPSSARDADTKGLVLAGKRRFVLAAAGVCAIFAIAVGLRLVRNSPETSQPAANRVTHQDGVAAAPATMSADAGSANRRASPAGPGAVLHEVMPEVSNQARNTINGTVKVKVRVVVNAQGKVSQATLAAPGPSRYFANQALQAARQWTFVAPIHDEKPEASEWTLAFEFRKSGTKATVQRASPT